MNSNNPNENPPPNNTQGGNNNNNLVNNETSTAVANEYNQQQNQSNNCNYDSGNQVDTQNNDIFRQPIAIPNTNEPPHNTMQPPNPMAAPPNLFQNSLLVRLGFGLNFEFSLLFFSIKSLFLNIEIGCYCEIFKLLILILF